MNTYNVNWPSTSGYVSTILPIFTPALSLVSQPGAVEAAAVNKVDVVRACCSQNAKPPVLPPAAYF
jgi:hypothetical protein